MSSHVFIIDDDEILRLLTIEMIESLDDKIICHQCENGKVGLETLEPMLNSSETLIVLLDLNMPVLNGWEFLDQLDKKDINKFKNLNLYVLTSSINDNDRIKSEQYPFVKKFYSKPLSEEDFMKVLQLEKI